MRMIMITTATLLVLTMSAAAQTVYWERSEISENKTGQRTYFDQEHHEEYVRSALEELTGKPPRPDATCSELAQITLDLLDGLRTYGERQVAMVTPEIPEWFMEGYLEFKPATVSASRYLDAVSMGEAGENGDLGALYAFWCAYDAEWFSVSRNAGYKAWLSAVLLNWPPHWSALRDETEQQLHERLVAPRQTADEPYREMDNWIKCFCSNDTAFIKPKVRDALVEELLAAAGMEGDERFFSDTAYDGPVPADLGLSEREYLLLAALCLEFSRELYELEPMTKQPLHFRDFFISTMRRDIQAWEFEN